MSNLLDIVEEPGPDVTSRNVFRHIWFSPTASLRFILKSYRTRYVHLLFILGALLSTLKRAAAWTVINLSDTWYLALGGILLGVLVGWLLFHMYSWAVELVCKWLKGKAKRGEVRIALAWSLLPIIASAPLLLVRYLLFGPDLFSGDKELALSGVSGILMVVNVMEFGLWLWTVVIFAKGVALVQEFGIPRAVMSIALPLLLFAIIAGFVAFIALDLFTAGIEAQP